MFSRASALGATTFILSSLALAACTSSVRTGAKPAVDQYAQQPLPFPIKTPTPEDANELANRCDQLRQKQKEELLREHDATRATLEKVYKALLPEQRKSLALLSEVLRDAASSAEEKERAKGAMIVILEDTLGSIQMPCKGKLYADVQTENEGKLQKYFGVDFGAAKLASVRRNLTESLGDTQAGKRNQKILIFKFNWLPGEEKFEFSAHTLPLKTEKSLLKDDGTPEQDFELAAQPLHQSLFQKIEDEIPEECHGKTFLETAEQKRDFGRLTPR